jgi:GMP synthase-like glutamine amidotransferase
MQSQQLHIGILQTDSVLEQNQPRFGDYPDMFMTLLAGGREHSPRFSTFVAQDIAAQGQGYPRPDVCDAYIITGSRHSVYDDEPWIGALVQFIATALAAERKVVGICFGHQLIAHFFGGCTEPAAVGWGAGVQKTQLLSQEGWMDPARQEIGLLCMHQDQVVRLPDNAQPIARSSHCPNAGFVIGDQVLTLQGHPEFSKSYTEVLMRSRRELLGEQRFQAGVASLREETHEALVARWILNFIEQN